MTCRDCMHYKSCLERDREYICSVFKQCKRSKRKYNNTKLTKYKTNRRGLK